MFSILGIYYALPIGNIWHNKVNVLKLVTVVTITLKLKHIFDPSTPSFSQCMFYIMCYCKSYFHYL